MAESDGKLTTYLPPPTDVDGFVAEATRRLGSLLPDHVVSIDWQWQPNEDWSERWRSGLRPRRLGKRLVVSPSWLEPELRAQDILIVVDPAMAFGTGEHATTRSALRLVEAAIQPGDRVLDVGTGSAILAIAAAKLGAGEVLAVENDADALENARENLERNGVQAQVRLEYARVDDGYLAERGPGRFDLIVANVLSSVLEPLLPAFQRALCPGGRLILGGILEEEAERILDAAGTAGVQLRVEDLEDEWWTGLFDRP